MARPAVLLMRPRISDCAPKRMRSTKRRFSAAKPTCLPVRFRGLSMRALRWAYCIEDEAGRLVCEERALASGGLTIEERFLATRPGAQKSGARENRVAALEMTGGGGYLLEGFGGAEGAHHGGGVALVGVDFGVEVAHFFGGDFVGEG